ncbi:MAG: sulfotransferase [Actinomycetia bacterium]|nr:sulfotransferase [Actinomycetes bacterium]
MHASPPILVVGISRRSGTNFLASLLSMHQDCAPPRAPLAEDHLLRDAPLLVQYAQRASERWPLRWGDRADARTRLQHHLGKAIEAFLADGVAAPRVVSKTPNPEHLELVPTLLPDAYVVVLLRDGRSAVQSLVRGFRFSFRKAVDEWAAGAAAIIRFQRDVVPANPGMRVMFVRYEDVVADPEGRLRALLEFCALDPTRFDFDAARNAPVIGSSFVRAEGGRMTWKPVQRSADFSPTDRFERWGRAKRERFEHLAGDLQRDLGYESSRTSGGAWTIYNRAADALEPVVRARDRAMHLYESLTSRKIRKPRTPSGDAPPVELGAEERA